MQLALIIAGVILLVIASFAAYKIGYNARSKADEGKIGNAEQKAREIIDDALKTAETKKRESLLERIDTNKRSCVKVYDAVYAGTEMNVTPEMEAPIIP